MEGKVLFTDMYCSDDEHPKHLPPLNDDEVGKDDLVPNSSDLGNEGMNDAAKILKGMNDGVEVVRINEQVLARQKELDKENDNPLSNESDSEDTIDEYAHMYPESEGDEFNKSFDYLSDGEDEVIKLRKRRIEFTNSIHKVDDHAGVTRSEQERCNDVDKFTDVDDNGLGLTPLVREHQNYMETLLRKLKGYLCGLTEVTEPLNAPLPAIATKEMNTQVHSNPKSLELDQDGL
ncbi:hypothetical protein Tco_0978454 [Tanacetum coccineum]|uniref:Uncharacterized protein n=1 Tax=Tanacetum coccineum TaxID=301880 RepID=A0ABQ5ENG2_9ASTR